MRLQSQWFFFNLILIFSCTRAFTDNRPNERRVIVKEASGITRLGDKLIIVGDDADGKYFELDLDGQRGPIIPIDPEKVREVSLPGAELAMDLEAVDILADGRIGVLSEQLRCLIAQESLVSNNFTVVAEYDKTLSEFGNRGLEGLAIAKTRDGSSKVAVLWEGGYPLLQFVPLQLRNRIGRFPMKPVIVVHEIKKGEVIGRIDAPQHYITLEVAEPPGVIPTAQRFRATDLVWHKWHSKKPGDEVVEGFIVLLTSENSPSDEPPAYEFKILQRFDLEGRPVGDPLSVNDICLESVKGPLTEICKGMGVSMTTHMAKIISSVNESEGKIVNWEGLGWFEEAETLVIIYDTWPMDPPFALVFDIPQEWK